MVWAAEVSTTALPSAYTSGEGRFETGFLSGRCIGSTDYSRCIAADMDHGIL